MPPRIGELLVQAGACTPAAVRDALENQAIFGGRLGTNLLELGAVTEEALARALGHRHGVPSLHGELRLDPAAVRLVKGELADRFEALPFLLADRRLAVVACDPSDLTMLDEVAFVTGKQVHPIVVPEARIWALLRETYGIHRQLRGIDVDFGTTRRAPAAEAAAPVVAARGGDLMGEDDFDAIYGKTGSFALPGAAPAPPPAARAAPPRPAAPPPAFAARPLDPLPPPPGDVVPLEELLLEEEIVEAPPAAVLDTFAASRGHAPPASIAPRAPLAPRRDEPEPSPLGFQEATRFLEGVEERGAIARTVLRYARARFKRAILLTVNRELAHGWAGLGEGLDAEVVHRIALRLGLGHPGVVDTVVRTRSHFLGPLQKTEANVRLLKQLGGGVPANAVLLPILARGRVVNVFYGDAGRGGMVDASGVGELLILATRISQSYEALVARAAHR